ncbi:glycosyltransferase family 2 protein [Flavobacterium sp. W21_SRS_FM6]|uniref:glycosyltransferase family 2 protein n=1 Tax=Flavobacterium sp. W21_SRS_FM6 TaxID=3240268 RepID=UPI003F8E723D
MKGTPKVSVILPVYNVELYLAECLDSVLTQSFQDFELIAVNDGSIDNSINILLEYEERFAGKLKIVEQKNQGLSAARNTGLENVAGQFIYFLDSDDWILPNTLETCVNAFEKNNADLVIFNAKAFCDGMPEDLLLRLDYTRNLPHQSYTNGHDLFEDSKGVGNYIVQSCCYMYRFSAQMNLRFIHGILHEDNYFTTMLFVNSSKIQVLAERFFQRRIRQNSITTSALSIKHAIGYYKTALVLREHLLSQSAYSKELSKYCNYLFQRGLKIEQEVSQGNIKLSRKWALITNFKAFINYKLFIRILFPTAHKLLVNLRKKNN